MDNIQYHQHSNEPSLGPHLDSLSISNKTISAPTMAPSTNKAVAAPKWSHTPTTPLLLWLGVSLPLVAWDTGYMLMRPHTMPGGSLHRPLWVPYALYGEVDHLYGFKQWHLKNPFAAAQSLMNVVETLLYLVYLAMWYSNGKPAAPGGRKAVGGRVGAITALLGFSAAVMTVSKTVLYCELPVVPPSELN